MADSHRLICSDGSGNRSSGGAGEEGAGHNGACGTGEEGALNNGSDNGENRLVDWVANVLLAGRVGCGHRDKRRR
jgi:hypothetical protein